MAETEFELNTDLIARSLALAGRDQQLCSEMFELLREAEKRSDDPAKFRQSIRWPLILAMLNEGMTHRVRLSNGLVFEIGADSRIDQALLLSTESEPDHVWEPQTTRLLVTLAKGATGVIVGGAYIGDHALPISQVAKRVHAFEPMWSTFERLKKNIALNGITNVDAYRAALWNSSDTMIRLDGAVGLASSVETEDLKNSRDYVKSITIDDFVANNGLDGVDLIMLDTEGGEERALRGAAATIASSKPNIIFEIHRHFVDWSVGLENTPPVKYLMESGYTIFAVRDYHGNVPMAGNAIEIIPVNDVYLEGPPHGFNMLAVPDQSIVDRIGLKVVRNVSPKLLFDKDPLLHAPLG